MGIFSGIKKVGGQVFNFKVTDWFNTDDHTSNFTYIATCIKNLFIPPKNQYQETFEEAMKRLNLTEEDISNRQKEFFKLFIISFFISISFFSYTIFITIKYHNFYGFILGVAVSILSLANTFKYHFWLTQINKRKLGLTLKDWLDY